MACGDWRGTRPAARPAYTLLELMLVLSLLVVLAFFIVPNFQSPIERSHLPESGERFRSFITLTRANAMLDGLRYRMRFLSEADEQWDKLSEHERLQPLIEFEADPIKQPWEFFAVKAEPRSSCSSLRRKDEMYTAMREELSYKREGMLEILEDEGRFRQAQQHYNNLQLVFDAVEVACTQEL